MTTSKGFRHTSAKEVNAVNKYERLKTKRKVAGRYVNTRRYVMQMVKVECQLYRGETKFPRTKSMTGREMGRENREFVLVFIKNMDAGKERPLYKWKLVDKCSIRNAINRNMR